VIVQVDTQPPGYRDHRNDFWQRRLRRRLQRATGQAVTIVGYTALSDLRHASAIVLGPSSAPWAEHDPAALDRLGEAVETSGRPVLGICAGLQLLGRFAGARIAPGVAEAGEVAVRVLDGEGFLAGVGEQPVVWQCHSDELVDVPPQLRVLAETDACRVQAIADDERGWYGTQFHPECHRSASPAGARILESFWRLACERPPAYALARR
jgi:GMP synthase (glutamine-hydrolysing)